MRWFVILPGALLPAPIAADVLAAGEFASIDELLAHASEPADTVCALEGAPHLAWLWQQFGGSGAPVTAPYALHAYVAEAAESAAQCWHVEAVHFEFARDHLLVRDLQDAPLLPSERAQLEPALRAALTEHAGDGAALRCVGEHWFLTLERPWNLQASPLDVALGQSAQLHWPSGPDAPRWRKLLNEVQIEWHEHPVNAQREASGRRTVNALWLHGGGAWAALPRRPFASLATDVDTAPDRGQGWARASGAVPAPEADAAVHARAGGDSLSIWPALHAPARAQAWGLWLQAAMPTFRRLLHLREQAFAAGYDEVVLVLGGEKRVRCVPLPRRRWTLARVAHMFRRRSASEVLAEPMGEAAAVDPTVTVHA